MLWSQLAPEAPAWPPEVRRHYRVTKYINASEGDLTAWRWSMEGALMRFDARVGPPSPAEVCLRRERVEAIEEIDRVLRWMRNTDWPFR